MGASGAASLDQDEQLYRFPLPTGATMMHLLKTLALGAMKHLADGEGIDDEMLSSDERRGLSPPRFLVPHHPSHDPVWQLPSDSLPTAVVVHVAARMIAMVTRDGLPIEDAAERLAMEMAPTRGGDTAAEL